MNFIFLCVKYAALFKYIQQVSLDLLASRELVDKRVLLDQLDRVAIWDQQARQVPKVASELKAQQDHQEIWDLLERLVSRVQQEPPAQLEALEHQVT